MCDLIVNQNDNTGMKKIFLKEESVGVWWRLRGGGLGAYEHEQLCPQGYGSSSSKDRSKGQCLLLKNSEEYHRAQMTSRSSSPHFLANIGPDYARAVHFGREVSFYKLGSRVRLTFCSAVGNGASLQLRLPEPLAENVFEIPQCT